MTTPRVELGDACAFLGSLRSDSVDLIVTDPAYESLEKHRGVGTTTRLQAWFPVFPDTRFPAFLRECYRVLKPDTHLYVMCDHETLFTIRPLGEEAGFRFWKPIVWDKVKIGMGYHYRARYEFVAFFEKGQRKLNDLGIPDVIQAARVNKGYPTEKPEELLSVLIEQSSRYGDLVVDPFLGSGSTGAAAVRLGRQFAGCDVEQSAVDAALARIRGQLLFKA